jgi:hypothetical protein
VAIRDLAGGYSQEKRPLRTFAGLTVAFNTAFAGILLRAKQANRELPERVSPGDIVLLGIATHKLSRLLAKDWVTSLLRAPFTTYQGPVGPGEVSETPRGEVLWRAMGQFVT